MILLRSLLFWVYFTLSQPLWFAGALLVWAVTLPFDRRRRLLHRYTCWWGSHYMYIVPWWHMRVIGREHLSGTGPCVITPNHQSLGDILVLFAIRRHFKWVSKQSVFAVPFLGWNMRMNDYVGLVRGDRESIQRMMAHCVRHLRQGSPVLMFPEGTRSEDGELRPFKPGAFKLAVDQQVPVVPVAVTGTSVALPKHGFWMRNDATIVVRLLPPIHPSAAGNDAARLSDLARAAIEAGIRQNLGLGPQEAERRESEARTG